MHWEFGIDITFHELEISGWIVPFSQEFGPHDNLQADSLCLNKFSKRSVRPDLTQQ